MTRARPDPYCFTPAFPATHFVSEYIAYASQRTDAAHEFHEAAALVALASATPNVRVTLAQFNRGLGTNLYVLFVGDSTKSRKSTAADLSATLIDRVIPAARLAEMSTPEAFVEQLARRNRESACWFVDEFGSLLEKLEHAKYMAGLRGTLLKVYDGRPDKYARHTKRGTSGERHDDSDEITDSNFSVLGCVTPDLFNTLLASDLQDGLLIRFGIIMPTHKPARRPFHILSPAVDALHAALAQRLAEIFIWAEAGHPTVRFTDGVLETIDALALELEEFTGSEPARAMQARLSAMAVKLAMLAAVGRPRLPDTTELIVEPEDARCGVAVARRWAAYNAAFGEHIGASLFERQLQRCLVVVRDRRTVPRRVVAQHVRCPKRTLDDIESTLIDRGQIAIELVKTKSPTGSGPDQRVWNLTESTT